MEGIEQLGIVVGAAKDRLALPVVAGDGQGIEGEGDIGRDRGGKPPCHRLPMPVVEDPGGDDLGQHQRQDNDEQRPAVERTRQDALEPAAVAVGAGRRPCRQVDEQIERLVAALNRA